MVRTVEASPALRPSAYLYHIRTTRPTTNRGSREAIVCLLFVCSRRCRASAIGRGPGAAPKIGALSGRRPPAQVTWNLKHPYASRSALPLNAALAPRCELRSDVASCVAFCKSPNATLRGPTGISEPMRARDAHTHPEVPLIAATCAPCATRPNRAIERNSPRSVGLIAQLPVIAPLRASARCASRGSGGCARPASAASRVQALLRSIVIRAELCAVGGAIVVAHRSSLGPSTVSPQYCPGRASSVP